MTNMCTSECVSVTWYQICIVFSPSYNRARSHTTRVPEFKGISHCCVGEYTFQVVIIPQGCSCVIYKGYSGILQWLVLQLLEGGFPERNKHWKAKPGKEGFPWMLACQNQNINNLPETLLLANSQITAHICVESSRISLKFVELQD